MKQLTVRLRDRSILLTLACVELIALAFLIYYKWTTSWDYQLGIFPYYQNFYNKASQGGLPWINFNYEYPPISILPLFGPALFVKGLTIAKVTHIRGVWSFALTILAVVMFSVRERKIRAIPYATLTIAFAIFGSCLLYFTYFDWAPLCLILISASLSNENVRSRALRTFVIVFGLFSKLVPGFYYPFLSHGKPGDPWYKRHWLLIAFLVGHLIFSMINLQGTTWALKYHSERPIDAYGIYGCIALLLGRMGISTDKAVFLNSTDAVAGSLANLFKPLSTLVTLAAFAYTYWLFRKATKSAPESERNNIGLLAGSLLILCYTLLGKLGQANYCFWVAACVALMSLSPRISVRQMWVINICSLLFCHYAVMQVEGAVHFIEPVVPYDLIVTGFIKFVIGLPIMVVCINLLSAHFKADKQPVVAAVS